MAKLSDFVRQEDLEGFWIYRKGRDEGRDEGREEGRVQTLHALLTTLLSEKFGALPPWAERRLTQITSPQEAQAIIRRLGNAQSLEEALDDATLL
jgi:hypothetical protein